MDQDGAAISSAPICLLVLLLTMIALGASSCGAANFSASGLKRQDNDLVVIENAEAAAAFKSAFEARFASGELLPAASAKQEISNFIDPAIDSAKERLSTRSGAP